MDNILLQIEIMLLYRIGMQSRGEKTQRELSFIERENNPVVRVALVEDDDPEVFQEPAKKLKTFIKPYVEVPKPSDMNFVPRSESKRAPTQLDISEKYKSLDVKLLRLKKKNRWKSAQEHYSRIKQDKKNTWW